MKQRGSSHDSATKLIITVFQISVPDQNFSFSKRDLDLCVEVPMEVQHN